MEKFIDDLDKAMKKNILKRVKIFTFVIGPLILSTIVYLFFNNTTLLMVGIGITSLELAITKGIDFVRDIKINDNNKMEDESEVDEVLEKGIGKKKGKDFYRESYKLASETKETDDEIKYREALESQLSKNSKKLPNNENDFLDKDETMVKILEEIDDYLVAYDLPPFTITNSQWDIIFSTIYNIFMEKGIEEKFYDSMSKIVRFVCSKCLINKSNSISLNEFIENLYYLQDYGISKKEILNIKRSILIKSYIPKVINFEDIKKKKMQLNSK